MILRFPDAATLVTAIRQGRLPAAVVAGPVEGTRTAAGPVALRIPHLTLAAGASLAAHGVTVAEEPATEPLRPLVGVAELIPLDKEPLAGAAAGRVLFAVPDAPALVRLAGTLRRLGHPAEGFRWPGRVSSDGYLLLATNPPAAALLGGSTAFAERAPRIWVEHGYRHPLLDLVRAPRGKLLLIHRNGLWSLYTDGPFHKVDRHVRERLPEQGGCWQPVVAGAPVTLPIRLVVRKNRREFAELWVWTRDALARLRRFVNDAPSDVVEGLDVAVAGADDRPLVLLRARPTRGGALPLVLDALACAPLLKLPNVYAPVEMELRPVLRRDYVRDTLAPPDRVTWLVPGERGHFVPTSVRADAFCPLSEWVEYSLPKPACPLPAQAPDVSLFALQAFRAPEDPGQRGKKSGKRDRSRGDEVVVPTGTRQPVQAVRGTAPVKPPQDVQPPSDADDSLVSPDAALARLIQMESEFLAIEGTLDDPRRLALWPHLAELYHLVGADADAALCWAHALWEAAAAAPTCVARWFRGEWGSRSGQKLLAQLDRLLDERDPLPESLRAVAVWVIRAGLGGESAGMNPRRLAVVGRFLEEHEARLPIRIAWLAWLAMARLAAGDVLGLTRARDRILGELVENGVDRNRDVPLLLRSAAGPDRLRAQVDAARFRSLHALAVRWAVADTMLRTAIDLTFGYGLARAGDNDGCRHFLREYRPRHQEGPQPLVAEGASADERATACAIAWLHDLYLERIHHQLEGRRAVPGLPRTLVRALADLPEERRRLVDRYRQASRILEPHERTDPYRRQRNFVNDDLGRLLADLPLLPTGERIEQSVRTLLKIHSHPGGAFRILCAAIPLAFRASDTFAHELLAKVVRTQETTLFHSVQGLISWAQLIETALALAAHHDRPALIPKLVGVLDKVLERLHGERAAWLCASLSGQGFRFLSRVGQRELARDFLDRLGEAVMEGDSVAGLLTRPALNHGVYLPALLRLAGGWFYFGREADGREVIGAVGRELFEGWMSPQPRTDLACGYAMTLGYAPLALALPAFDELFRRLSAPADPVAKIRVIEAVVLAMSGEEFAADPAACQLLDEDEYLIRRRIHRDVRAALARAGL